MLESSYTLQMPPGTSIVIEIPVDDEGSGFFPNKGPIKWEGNDQTLLNGFFVESVDVGTIEDVVGNELAVTYTHIKPSENKIRFYADSGERCIVMIINVPIHDHSSVVQGGPAFGTYYVDEEEGQ